MSGVYKTIEKSSEGNFLDKGSKFPAYAYEVSSELEIKTRLNQIKELHPKATHHCYAYKLGLDNNNYRANDDGEPTGSAGRPILGQIYSNELTNVMIVVVRYYGGTKLGVSGLINAYKKAAQDAINNTNIIEKEVQVCYHLTCNYLQINDLLNFLKKSNVHNLKQEFTESCSLTFNIEISKEEIINSCLDNKAIKYSVKEVY